MTLYRNIQGFAIKSYAGDPAILKKDKFGIIQFYKN